MRSLSKHGAPDTSPNHNAESFANRRLRRRRMLRAEIALTRVSMRKKTFALNLMIKLSVQRNASKGGS